MADQRPGNSGGVSRGEAVIIVPFTDSLPNLDRLERAAPGANVKLLRRMEDSLLQPLLRFMGRSGTHLDFPHCYSHEGVFPNEVADHVIALSLGGAACEPMRTDGVLSLPRGFDKLRKR